MFIETLISKGVGASKKDLGEEFKLGRLHIPEALKAFRSAGGQI